MANDAKPHARRTPTPSESGPMARVWSPLWSLRDEIDELFDDFQSGGFHPFRRLAARAGRPPAVGFVAPSPRLDVVEREDEICISAELPGMEDKDIDVRVGDATVTLRGEKKQEREEGEKGGEYYLSERRYGAFERTVPIPEGIDHERIEASFRNGVLSVRLPKKPEARHAARKIEVKTS